ncbi:glycine--tRNA ligase subunit beta [Roseicyclus marinus]|uniref:glycine--tRNA ligase subunit beta n=1 Tax=Roseicyclus marinus TaxID=2161673 RepID=UPI00241072BA|nr:glycine--tRNA ligase subunit beta [Roseicyclus marinus]MDG3042307.1 glycine--tRNA ligase subunit beta [Roseicyclus marinus]
MPDLLLELFSEEIPARMQARAADDLKRLVTDGLVEAGLTYASAGAFATPRRLALTIEGLTAHSPTTREERRGPRTDASDQAIEGFLRGAGLTRDQLQTRSEKKGEVYVAVIEKPGRPAPEIIADVVTRVIRDFPWPKSMRWGAGSLRWVRPLQSILCLLSSETGSDIVPFEVDGIVSGNTTEGHRFMAPARFTVAGFADYEAKLKRAHVILSAAERAEHIQHEAEQMAFAAGLELVADAGLLAEVAGLVEWPVVLMGRIEDRFLDLPPEVLQTSMREHQKFFSVRNPKTGRIERFITVANRETADQGATILAGNQKVLSARLSDAAFFWENDLRVAKAGMGDWLDGLASVTFHAKLGSQAARIDRIAALAREIAPMVGADADLAEEAARIAKADLRSEMVGEFPELQGVMGRYYALAAGRAAEVADAARDHWKPMGQGDEVPTAPVALAVALADKIDTLTGFWAIDEKPTGSKDPYALRRAALGVVRMVLENGVRIDLKGRFGNPIIRRIAINAGQPLGREMEALESLRDQRAENLLEAYKSENLEKFKESLGHYFSETMNKSDDLLAFFHDRLKVHLRDEGIRHDIIDAALAKPPADDLFLVVARARALAAFLATPDGENLVQGYRRAANILTQAEEKDGVEYRYGADPKFAETDEERALFDALATAQAAIKPALEAEDFAAAMTHMASLRAPIDAFFTAVQVNADNQVVRRNRLNLLYRIVDTCGAVADLSRIEG